MNVVAAVNFASILFPTGNARLSTIIAFAAFVALAATRHSRAPLLACLAWLFGFEAAFNITVLALGRPATLDTIHFAVYLVLGIGGPWLLARRGWTPDRRFAAATVVSWLVWAAVGFHINQHTAVGFDPAAEVLNELCKTLWAAAYLAPLLRAPAAASVRGVGA